MKSTKVPYAARLSRLGALLWLAATASLFLTGCAEVRQYSINSWAGPLPMSDFTYVQQAP
jgi:hypothetical protein